MTGTTLEEPQAIGSVVYDEDGDPAVRVSTRAVFPWFFLGSFWQWGPLMAQQGPFTSEAP